MNEFVPVNRQEDRNGTISGVVKRGDQFFRASYTPLCEEPRADDVIEVPATLPMTMVPVPRDERLPDRVSRAVITALQAGRGRRLTAPKAWQSVQLELELSSTPDEQYLRALQSFQEQWQTWKDRLETDPRYLDPMRSDEEAVLRPGAQPEVEAWLEELAWDYGVYEKPAAFMVEDALLEAYKDGRSVVRASDVWLDIESTNELSPQNRDEYRHWLRVFWRRWNILKRELAAKA